MGMTKKEFEMFRAENRRLWKEAGDLREKPEWSSIYMNFCPACEVAYLTKISVYKEDVSLCGFCPIDEFRSLSASELFPPCVSLGSPYRAWASSRNVLYARKVKMLKWSWLDDYEKTVVPKELIEEIKEREEKMEVKGR